MGENLEIVLELYTVVAVRENVGDHAVDVDGVRAGLLLGPVMMCVERTCAFFTRHNDAFFSIFIARRRMKA